MAGRAEGRVAGRTGHTPGPWSVARNGRQIVSDTAVQGVYRVVVARVTDEEVNGVDCPPHAAAEANARLIAAAPDLLEALRDIVEEAARTRFALGADLADSINVLGRAAIAKAEGRS